MSSGATVKQSRLSWLPRQACRVCWHLCWHGSQIFSCPLPYFFVSVMLESSFKCLEGFVVCAFLLHTEESYFMRINIGSKSVLEAKHILSGFRLWFSYMLVSWKLFCKHRKRLYHLLLIMSCFLSVGSYVFEHNKFGYSVSSSILITLKSFKSFNSCWNFLLWVLASKGVWDLSALFLLILEYNLICTVDLSIWLQTRIFPR